MRKLHRLVALAAALTFGVPAPAGAFDFGRALGGAAKAVTGAVKGAVEGAKKTLSTVGRAAGHAVRGAQKAAAGVGKAVSGVLPGGDILEKATELLQKTFGLSPKDLFCRVTTVALTGGLGMLFGKQFCAALDLVMKMLPHMGSYLTLAARHGPVKALQLKFDDLKKDLLREAKQIQGKLKGVFADFKSVLTRPAFSLEAVAKFGHKVFTTVNGLLDRLAPLVPMPWPLDTLYQLQISAGAAALISGATIPLGAVHFALKKLMAFLIPKLLLGVGKAADYAGQHLPPDFPAFANGLIRIAGSVAGGVIDLLVTRAETRERLKAVLLKVADVAGKVQGALQAGLKIAEAARDGSFEGLEAALKSPRSLPERLGKEDLTRMAGAFIDFARDELWALASEPLRNLLSNALTVLDGVVEVPRKALVTALGTIPAVGGVLAGGLDLGLAAIVGLIKSFATEQVLALAKEIVDDLVRDARGEVEKALLTTPGAARAATGIAKLARLASGLAGEISGALKAAAGGLRGSLGSLAVMAVREMVLRGVAHPGLRRVLSEGLSALGDKLSQPGASPSDAVAAVVRRVAGPLAEQASAGIGDDGLRAAAAGEVRTVLEEAGTAAGVRGLLADPLGFLGGVAKKVVARLRASANAAVQGAAARIEAAVKTEGISALMRLGEIAAK
jgi:hypothetical protein